MEKNGVSVANKNGKIWKKYHEIFKNSIKPN